MPHKPAPQPDDPEQSKRFIDTAREVEADEDPEAFERVFGAVVKSPPKPEEGDPKPAIPTGDSADATKTSR